LGHLGQKLLRHHQWFNLLHQWHLLPRGSERRGRLLTSSIAPITRTTRPSKAGATVTDFSSTLWSFGDTTLSFGGNVVI
jgi:hypothetical protein